LARRSYHHGNLKQTLIEATLDLVEERGPQAFTLAEAAKRAKVSVAAPYRHFRSKQDLFVEIARQGFEMFADLMEYAFESANASPLAAFEATGHAYLAFARRYPGHYILMFESGVPLNATPGLAHEAQRAKAVVQRAAERLVVGIPEDSRPPPTMVSDHIWAFSHGVVELFARNPDGTRTLFSAEDLLETGMGVYLRGLGLLEMDTRK